MGKSKTEKAALVLTGGVHCKLAVQEGDGRVPHLCKAGACTNPSKNGSQTEMSASMSAALHGRVVDCVHLSPVCCCAARVHPGESNASWMMKVGSQWHSCHQPRECCIILLRVACMHFFLWPMLITTECCVPRVIGALTGALTHSVRSIACDTPVHTGPA
jgi:hypothetical protein